MAYKIIGCFIALCMFVYAFLNFANWLWVKYPDDWQWFANIIGIFFTLAGITILILTFKKIK